MSVPFYFSVSVCIAILLYARKFSNKLSGSIWPRFGQTAVGPVLEPLRNFDWTAETPLAVYKEPYLRSKKYVLTMGLQKCDYDHSMLIDSNYQSRMLERKRILREHEKDTLACLSGAEESCAEALRLISSCLVQRYPSIFEASSKGCVLNKVTKDVVDTNLRGLAALKAISQLSEEDVLVLQYSPTEQSYVLRAATSAFPNGFSFIEKMGKKLSSIHTPVPNYAQKLERSMDRYFHKVERGTLVVRYNWGITAHANLFSTSGTHMHADDSLETVNSDVTIDDCHVRCERQVLQRMPKSGDLLFTVKTYLFKLTEIAHEPDVARNLRGAIEGLQGEMGYYKGKPRWEHIVVPYLDGILDDPEDLKGF